MISARLSNAAYVDWWHMWDVTILSAAFAGCNWSPARFAQFVKPILTQKLGYGRTLYIDYEAWVCYFLWVCSIVRIRFYYLPVFKREKTITACIEKVESNWTRRKVPLKQRSVQKLTSITKLRYICCCLRKTSNIAFANNFFVKTTMSFRNYANMRLFLVSTSVCKIIGMIMPLI